MRVMRDNDNKKSTDVTVLFQQAASCFQRNQVGMAEQILHGILETSPNHADANHLLGLVAIHNQRHDAAAEYITRAIEANPGQPIYYYNLGIALQAAGNSTAASTAYWQAINLNPHFIEAYINYGNSLKEQDRLAEALNAYEKVVQLAPERARSHYNLGNTLNSLGRRKEALAAYEKAIQLDPDFGMAYNNYSNVLREMKRLDEALEANRHVLRLEPENADAHNIRGSILSELERHQEALVSYERAIVCSPEYADAHCNRGNALSSLGRYKEALQAYGEALRIKPDFAENYGNLADALIKLGHMEAALDASAEAVRLRPDLAKMHCVRGNVLMASGDSGAAVDSYRQALQLDPDYTDAHSNLLFALAAGVHLPASALLEEQRSWDRVHGREGRLQSLPERNHASSTERRLRIGYLSPDFHQHPVSYFFEPLLAAHDTSRFEIFCYASHPSCYSDATTQRLRSLAEHWHFATGQNDKDLASRIHRDGIDILIDLAGHTLGNRLKVFTYRPAPVQVTYLGFFAGTGMESIDYWITDDVLHPQETSERSVEVLYRLPRCWVCYRPPENIPEILPCSNDNACITFGCFSNLSKLSPAVIETWSQLLQCLYGSRLLLINLALSELRTRQRLLKKFSHYGIPAERLILRGYVPHAEYMAAYSEVDIMLDTFPRTGGTTTAEALWMGVPVVTLAGQRYVERISASKLVAVGLEDLITYSREEYIDKAVALANDSARRIRLRHDLRERMRQSALCDAEGLALVVENAYQDMWERYLMQTS